MIQQHHLGTQGRALGCNDGITKTRADVHGMFPTLEIVPERMGYR